MYQCFTGGALASPPPPSKGTKKTWLISVFCKIYYFFCPQASGDDHGECSADLLVLAELGIHEKVHVADNFYEFCGSRSTFRKYVKKISGMYMHTHVVYFPIIIIHIQVWKLSCLDVICCQQESDPSVHER